MKHRTHRNPAAREGRRQQEDRVDGADEHRPCLPAHRQLRLERGIIYLIQVELQVVQERQALSPSSSCLSSRRCRSHESIAGRRLPLSLLPCQPYNTDNDTVKRARQQTYNLFAQQARADGLLCAAAAQSTCSRASPRWCRTTRRWCRSRLPSPLSSSCAPVATQR